MNNDDGTVAAEATRRNITARLLACSGFELKIVDTILELIEKEREAYLRGPLPEDRHTPNGIDRIVEILVARELARAGLREEVGREIASMSERPATMRPLIESAYEHERTQIGASSIARSHADLFDPSRIKR